eukprot:Rmarinus@m.8891
MSATANGAWSPSATVPLTLCMSMSRSKIPPTPSFECTSAISRSAHGLRHSRLIWINLQTLQSPCCVITWMRARSLTSTSPSISLGRVPTCCAAIQTKNL